MSLSLSDQAADRILCRAIALAETHNASVTLSHLRDSAQQLGVPSEFVDRAIAEAIESGAFAAAQPAERGVLVVKSRSVLMALARHAIVGLCVVPAVWIAQRMASSVPWQYLNAVEGLAFGAVLFLVARVMRARIAQVGAAYLLLVHLTLVITTLHDDRGFGVHGGAPNAAALAAALAGSATALWFLTQRARERRTRTALDITTSKRSCSTR